MRGNLCVYVFEYNMMCYMYMYTYIYITGHVLYTNIDFSFLYVKCPYRRWARQQAGRARNVVPLPAPLNLLLSVARVLWGFRGCLRV